jgi:hypothetical protein
MSNHVQDPPPHISGHPENKNALLRSRLTDSNRRSPPYHLASAASGCNKRRLVARTGAGSRLCLVAATCVHLRPLCSPNAPSSEFDECRDDDSLRL